MKTVRDACTLQSNALTIKLSEQIEQQDELITTQGDGSAFLERMHIMQGKQDLISDGLAWPAGFSSQAVFHLKQSIGGGKTHLLVGFGLMAKHPELSKECVAACSMSRFSIPMTSPPSTAGTTLTTFSGAKLPTNSARASSSGRSGPLARTGGFATRLARVVKRLLHYCPDGHEN